MNIHDINRIGAIKSYQAGNSKPSKQESAQSMQKDMLQISPEAKEKLQLSKDIAVGREEKLNQLKQQIDSGTYQVDSNKLADQLLSLWQKNQR
jgi:negative regulator of flagellin synthesis FlgM